MIPGELREKVSIIIPAKDEEASIGLVLQDLKNVVGILKKYDFEVLVIDDGSQDRTAEIARMMGIKVIANAGAHGKGNALRCGFKEAMGDIIIMLDADYSHRPEDIPEFLQKIKNAMLVVGSRHTGGSDEYETVRGLGNYMLSFVFRVLWGQKISDILNGYKCFKKQVVKNYEYTSKNFEIELELVANALKEGGPIAEVPSHERERAGGEMKSHAVREGWKFLWAILRHGFAYRLSSKK